MKTMLTHDEHVRVPCRDLAGLRVLAAAPPAMVVTLILLWGMEQLIRSDENLDVPEVQVHRVPDPVMVEPPPPQVLYSRPKPPEVVEIEPPILEVSTDIPKGNGGFAPPTAMPPPSGRPALTGLGGNTPVATMLLQPTYPTAAANRGLEGFVDVEFDITETGATTNVRVIGAQPANVFERETIRAVKRWKFSPVIRDGRPAPYFGMVQRVHFQMEKS